MPPKTAYTVLKFTRKVESEYALIEKQRVKLLRDVTGIKEGDIKLTPGDPEHQKFIEGFNEILNTESDLEPCSIKLCALIDSLNAEQSNVLSARDIAVLETFFQPEEEGHDAEKSAQDSALPPQWRKS